MGLLFYMALAGVLALAGFFFLRFLFRYMIDRRISTYQSELVEKHCEEVENMYRQVRGWRHDYKHHIQTMKAHLAMKQYDVLENYARKGYYSIDPEEKQKGLDILWFMIWMLT